MVCSNIKWGTFGLIKGVNMRLFLSTLTEMDYIETLNKIESSYDDKGQVLVKSKENSFQDYAEH